MASNMFKNKSAGLDTPADLIVPATKDDNNDLEFGVCRALLVGGAGSATIQQADGTTRTNIPLQAGYNPIRVSRLMLGGTATDIWALY